MRVVEPRGPPAGRRRARPRRTGRASAGASGPGAADGRRTVPSAPRRARSSSPGEIQVDPAFQRGRPPLFPPGRRGRRVPAGEAVQRWPAPQRAQPARRPRPRPPDRPSGPVRGTTPPPRTGGGRPGRAAPAGRLGKRARRLAVPQDLGDPRRRDDVSGVQGEERRQQPVLTPPSCFGAPPTRTSTGPSGRICSGSRYRAGYRPQQGTVRCPAVRRSVQDRVSAGLQARPRQACPLPGRGGTSRGAGHDRKDQAAGRRGGRGPRRERGLALVPGTPAEAGTVAACTSFWGSSPDMARIVCRESDFDHTLWSQNHVYHGLGQIGTPAVDGAGTSWDSCVNGRPGRHPRAPDAAASVLRLPTRREDSPGTSEATSKAPRSARPGTTCPATTGGRPLRPPVTTTTASGTHPAATERRRSARRSARR